MSLPKIRIALPSALALGVCVAAGCWLHDWPVSHFATVEPGILYRSAQPDLAGLRRLRDHYGIRTIISLRRDAPDEPWARQEREFCAQNGIAYLLVPIGDDSPTDPQLQTILSTIDDPAAQPVLIHCEYGKSRTGVVVAAYRIATQGWQVDRALEEASQFKEHMRPVYKAYLRRLEPFDPCPQIAEKQPDTAGDSGYR